LSTLASALRVGRLRWALSPPAAIFLLTRLGVWGAAALALAWFPRQGGGFGTTLWVRGDSAFYAMIASHGYAAGDLPAFFPGYPTLVAGLGWVLGDYYLAGLLISLAACLVAFELLWLLAASRIGATGGTRAVLYLALFPMSVFLQAVYSESLFLALALAAFVLAERGHWPLAAVAAGCAMLTRSIGLAILAGLAVMAWPSLKRLGWLLIAPAMFAAFPVALNFQAGDAWAFVHAQGNWHRSISWAGPLGGLWYGIAALWGRTDNFSEHYYLALNIVDLAYLVPFLALLPLVWRRVGKPYAVYTAFVLAIPLSVPSKTGDFPLFSMPRFTMLAFPFFIALAVLGARSNVHTAIVAVSSVLLGVAIVQWTLWNLS
jgi:hypothetical protein